MMKYNLNKFLNQEISCACGSKHRCSIEQIIIEDGALKRLPDLVRSGTEEGRVYRNVCLVADSHTWKAAGEQAETLLKSAGLRCGAVIFKEEALIPDERAVGGLLADIPRDCDLIIAVGSGTINDLCKFISSRLGLEYMVVATAPSMDGYASSVAPLIIRSMKVTYDAKLPKAIIGDTAVMAQAPPELIAAGIGDILGKYVCLTDWRLSHIVTGEYYCSYAAELVRKALETIVQACSDWKGSADKELIASVMEGLVLSGIVMGYIGNSRPASGSEHHLSHFWEMSFLQHGSHGALHGAKVGVGTVICLGLYQEVARLLKEKKEFTGYHFSKKEWEQEIRRVYKTAADGVIRLEAQTHKNEEAAVEKRRAALMEHKEEVLALIRELPGPEEVTGLLRAAGAPWKPSQLEVTEAMAKDGIRYAKELRNRYGLLQLLHDTSMTDIAMNAVIPAFFNGCVS